VPTTPMVLQRRTHIEPSTLQTKRMDNRELFFSVDIAQTFNMPYVFNAQQSNMY